MSIYKNGQKVLGSFNDVTGFVEKSDITTTINSSSTDSQVPSAKSVWDNAIKDNNIKTYTSLDQLGLTTPISVGDLFVGLPDDSLLRIQCDNDAITGVPHKNGILIIDKCSNSKFSIEFKISAGGSVDDNTLFIGQLKGVDGTGLSWRRVCATSVADVPLTKIIFRDTTNYEAYNQGTNAYEVVNGICYLQADVTVKNKVMVFNEVLNGLPMSKTLQHGLVSPWNSNNTNANLLFEIRNGALLLAYGEPSQHHLINIAYPVKES